MVECHDHKENCTFTRIDKHEKPWYTFLFRYRSIGEFLISTSLKSFVILGLDYLQAERIARLPGRLKRRHSIALSDSASEDDDDEEDDDESLFMESIKGEVGITESEDSASEDVDDEEDKDDE
jgi:hypothetical protein